MNPYSSGVFPISVCTDLAMLAAVGCSSQLCKVLLNHGEDMQR